MYKELISFIPEIYFILQGTFVTLQYGIICLLLGVTIGTLIAICKIIDNPILRIFAYAYTSIFRGTPMLVQLTIIYFGLPGLINIKISIFVAGVITFSLNSGAYVSEIIRGGINAINKGQFEAAKTLGITKVKCIKDIILPQAMRNIFPALVNEFITLIKESAVISVIGGMDLMRRAQIVAAETYSYFIPTLIAALGYYSLVIIITIISKIIENKIKI